MSRYLQVLMSIALVVALGVMGVSSPAHALQMLRLTDGTTTTTITDGGLGDLDPNVGAVSFIGAIGNFFINVTTGLSKPVLGSAAIPEMDLNSINVSSSGGGLLTISHTDTGFTGSWPGFVLRIAGITGGIVTYSALLDTGNTEFVGTSLATLGSLSGVFTGSTASGSGVTSAPYSLTQVATITHAGAATTSFNADLNPVPEPATLLLLGGGLVGLAGYGWRRRKV